MSDIAIIGLGPWGLAFLERFVTAASRDVDNTEPVTVHVFDPGPPGVGAFGLDQPDYLILNTPCGWHSTSPYPEEAAPGRLGFFEWLAERNYRWDGHHCRPGAPGPRVGFDDFLPRHVMGEYLNWSYNVLVAEAPDHVTIVHHQSQAESVVPIASGGERVTSAAGESVDVDHVVMATGHTENAPDREGAPFLASIHPYPVENYGPDKVPAGAIVAIRGMGLVAHDVVSALTIGRGGTFEPAPDEDSNRLVYRPSGEEPLIHLFSRTGYLYCAKSSRGRPGIQAPYVPAICTFEAIEDARQRATDHKLDARRDLLPLLFAEMQLRYVTQAAEIGHAGADPVHIRSVLTKHWLAGTFAEGIAEYNAEYGYFDPEEHFFRGHDATYDDASDYSKQVEAVVEFDIAEALAPGFESPVKAAYGVPRLLRDVIRAAVDGRGLTVESHLDFQTNIRPRIGRMIAGPPTGRAQQFLALIDAGVVHLSVGPSPLVETAEGGGVTITSTRLAEPVVLRARFLIDGLLGDPKVEASHSPLFQNLYSTGRVRPLELADQPVGSIDVSATLNPIGADDALQKTLWTLGSVTEGARYYTGYIPSPKDRRASLDAAVMVAEIRNARS